MAGSKDLASQRVVQNDGNESLRKELSIAVFALIINAGFFKLTEIDQFVAVFSRIGTTGVTVGTILTILVVGVSYIVFIFAVGLGLFEAFRGKDIRRPMVVALGSFFALYVTLLFKAFGEHSLIVPNVGQ